MDTENDFDFGFSFSDETEIAKDLTDHLNIELSDCQTKLQTLYNAIIPFLDNLCRDPDKSTIHWPDRVEKIQIYKRKLKNIVEGNNT